MLAAILVLFASGVSICNGQLQGGVYDFGQGRYGERRGDLTPSQWLSVVLLLMVIAAGLAFAIALCYYVSKRATSTKQGHSILVERV